MKRSALSNLLGQLYQRTGNRWANRRARPLEGFDLVSRALRLYGEPELAERVEYGEAIYRLTGSTQVLFSLLYSRQLKLEYYYGSKVELRIVGPGPVICGEPQRVEHNKFNSIKQLAVVLGIRIVEYSYPLITGAANDTSNK
jgi:hypothetical protein